MFSSALWGTTVLAIGLAVVAALCFAYASFLQQRTVAAAPREPDASGAAGGTRVGANGFRWLARQPRWLAGWGLVGGGSLLHVGALMLAPVSVVQPIGILAVPTAVLLTARADRTWPRRTTVLGVVLAVAGTAAFVLVAGGGAVAVPPVVPLPGLLIAVGVVAAVVAGLTLVGRRGSGWLSCLGYAAAGAVSYGFGSTLIHLIGQTVTADTSTLLSPVVITGGLAIAAALTVGAWSVQQAYASGPASTVVGALTVGDPLVAVVLSVTLLGEGVSHTPTTVVAMIASAIAAAAGVRLLAAHHPAPVREPEQDGVLASVR